MIIPNATEMEAKAVDLKPPDAAGANYGFTQHRDIIRLMRHGFRDEQIPIGERLYALSPDKREMVAAFEIDGHGLDFRDSRIRIWFGLVHGSSRRRAGRCYAGLTWDGYPAVLTRFACWRHRTSNDMMGKIRKAVANTAFAMTDYPNKLGELLGRRLGPIEYQTLCVKAADAGLIKWSRVGIMRRMKTRLEKRIIPGTALSAVLSFGLAMEKAIWTNPRTDAMACQFKFYKSLLGSAVRG